MKIKQSLATFSLVSLTLIPVLLGAVPKMEKVTAQPIGQAVVFAPPSNVRFTPNGEIMCSVTNVRTINIYDSVNGWYVTDVCGEIGYIHASQIRLKSNPPPAQGRVICEVINIRTGQLALRFSPNGKSRAGLDNGNIVALLSQQGVWYKVRVIQGPNPRVNGLEGWVNSNYLSCGNR